MMINPSTLDIKTLPWLPLEEKAIFPSRPAIYFAIDSLGTVQYIGRTVNVRSRWGKHHKYSELSAIANIKIAYLFIDAPELLPDIEQALIQYFNPLLNDCLRAKTHLSPAQRKIRREREKTNKKIKLFEQRLKACKEELKAHGEELKAHGEELKAHGEELKARKERLNEFSKKCDLLIKALQDPTECY